jgi:hypothetical protein
MREGTFFGKKVPSRALLQKTFEKRKTALIKFFEDP